MAPKPDDLHGKIARRRLLPRDSSPKLSLPLDSRQRERATGRHSFPLELACIRFLSPWVRPSAWRERGRGVPGMAWAIPELGVGGGFLVSLVPGKAFPSACPGDIAWRAGSAQLSLKCWGSIFHQFSVELSHDMQ